MREKQELSAMLGYAENTLNRRAELRERPDDIDRLFHDPAMRTIVIKGDIPVLKQSGTSHDAFFARDEVRLLGDVRERIFLGMEDTRAIFAVQLAAEEPDVATAQDGLLTLDLRSIGVQGLVAPAVLGMLGTAKSLLGWHQRHRFCAVCGHASETRAAGWKRGCLSCGAEHFPRTDPVVIMMAVKGDRCVMGRQSRFAPGVYSCLAGFVEPGETLEDAVRRELFEEAGLAIGQVRYLASQPWPFPGSLMIGAIAETSSDNIVIDHDELEDARWFTRDEVRKMLSGTHPDGLIAPPPIAIAHSLMKAWVNS